jgi:hypothetical protein
MVAHQGFWNFITMVTSEHLWILSWANLIHSNTYISFFQVYFNFVVWIIVFFLINSLSLQNWTEEEMSAEQLRHCHMLINVMFCWPCVSLCACGETNLMHFIFSLFSQYIPTCFGLASCPSSGGNDVYMWQLVHVVRVCGMLAGLDDLPTVPHIHSYLLMMGN